MARNRRGPNLFEVMNKVPQGQALRNRPGLLSRVIGTGKESSSSRSLVVAQAMTEEEAAAELAARRATEEASRRSHEEAQRKREEQRQAREEAKRKHREAKALEKAKREEGRRRAAEETSSMVSPAGGSIIRLLGRRLVLALDARGLLYGLACVCIMMLAAYSLGRRSVNGSPGHGLSQAAAITQPSAAVKNPLLPRSEEREEMKSAPKAAAHRNNPDLSELLSVPEARRQNLATPNQPASVDKSPSIPTAQVANPAGAVPEDLNYLQIESFSVTRYRTSEQLKDDVAAVRKFLAERGIPTFARKLSNGYVLFGEQGFPTGASGEQSRQSFKRKIQELGKEFRRQGGLYEFKEPFYVSHTATKAGQAT